MKPQKLIVILLLPLLFVSCKKNEKPTPEPTEKDITVWTELYAANGKHLLDSVQLRVCTYKGGVTEFSLDSTYAFTMYSGANGKATMKLASKGLYCIVATSKTYKMSYATEPHYYKKTIFITVEDYDNVNTYLNGTITTYFQPSYRIPGYGINNHVTQDPSE